MLEHKEHIVKLFQEGTLNVGSANWYQERGYDIVIKDGKVVDIVKAEEMHTLDEAN